MKDRDLFLEYGMEYYVYAHCVTGESTPFYIGKGKGNRAYDIKGRSKFWSRKAKNGFTVIFLHSNLTESESLLLEIDTIRFYGRRDNGTGCLVNHTDGGDGLINPSQETRKKIGDANKERFKDVEFRKKFSQAQKNKVIKESTKNKMSQFQTNRFKSIEERNVLKKLSQDAWDSPELRKKQSELISKKHRENPEIAEKIRQYRLGKTLSDESRRKLSQKKSGKSYALVSPDGTEYICLYQSEFAREHNLNVKSLHSLLKGKCRTYKGWKLKDAEDTV
jgi:Ni/Co efflux regulator RcnB